MMRRLLLWLLIFFCNEDSVIGIQRNATVNVNIGVIYGQGSSVGKMGLQCIQMALSHFYNSRGCCKTRIVLHPRTFSKDSVIGAASAALYLLKGVEVKAIIGATNSMEAEFIMHLGEKAQVPIISYSVTRPNPSFSQTYFINAAQDELLQAKPISALIKAFGWREVVPVYVQSDHASALLVLQIADALQTIEARSPYQGVIPSSATDDQIHKVLSNLKAKHSRVFVLDIFPELASRFFMTANELGMMEAGYVWILTTRIGNALESLNPNVTKSMEGVLCLKTYIPETNQLKDFQNKWARKFVGMKLNVMGLWAYDAATALAMAIEQVRSHSPGFEKKKMSANSTVLDALGVYHDGPKLLHIMLNSSFKGLAGSFNLNSGQLESSTYQIVNVIAKSARDIGFWTPDKGLEPLLNSPSSNVALRKIIWPGDTVSLPIGWEIPTGGKKLRVGVPVKDVYQEMVNVSYQSDGNPVVTGFCIDVFDAVMKKLGYSGRYYYIPFANQSGSPAGTYDDLVQQVSLQKYDVAVGDITIIANRTMVDFTLPYTESGMTMVVPVKNEKSNAWVFLKPLTSELWTTSLCAFIFIAFVIWILEHRINEDFRGPLSHQAGTSLFFSFSMAVFAQRENVLSNLTRFVVIVWVFVVLVLTQSYTASLASMLTVQKLQPTVTDVQELIHKGDSVGFLEASFVRGLLKKRGFSEAKLVSYSSLEQLDSLLSKGSKNGGISAVFDEIPYMKIFLARYPSKYTMVQPNYYKTDGFGFAFPKGSPLVSEVSRNILKVTEGDEMANIETKWSLQLSNDNSDQGNTVTSESLALDSFCGLFLIAGIASGVALFVFTATFLYEHRQTWMNNDASGWSKIEKLGKAFGQRDYSFHTFRKHDVQSKRTIDDHVNINDVGITQGAIGSPSPPRSSGFPNPDQIENSLSSSATSASPLAAAQSHSN